ncbi:hypothetical protein ACOMHN_061596 [Nucella lapillus]
MTTTTLKYDDDYDDTEHTPGTNDSRFEGRTTPPPTEMNLLRLQSLPSDKGTTQGYHHQPPLATSLRL